MRALLLAAVLLVVSACTSGADAGVGGAEFQFVSPGGQTEIFYEPDERQQIPEMSGEDLMNEGERISVSDFAGDVVVLNIWGSWCSPCRVEAPELQEVYELRKDQGVTVLGIDVRDGNRTAPQDFVRDTGLTYPSIYDFAGRSLFALKGYPRSIVPSTIVLDSQHRVAAVYLQSLLAEDLLPVVDRLLAEKNG
ncbi:TlpA family protein disulfide reductase [Actinophytocola gossypii]|uniref:TlpA family protein disulfide reductase n=1 Tax=Actinophytocola gossypii TaxID=2812003 RepID=A0ABT2JE02_9PSEU|nr:TlpA disulfide reductase family protein [Actinophytocola gossypii]MCT2585655.1 TlpA family protein disulfide reductase [Actinophytocola gossypii]